MRFDLSNLCIGRVIAHEALRQSDIQIGKKPAYSDEEMTLSTEDDELLSERLLSAVGSDTHSIEMEVKEDFKDSAFDPIIKLFNVPKTDFFVETTQNIAAKLTNLQTGGNIKPGILVVAEGTTGFNGNECRYIAIIKAEIDAGFQKVKTAHGFQLKLISDLVLGAQQKLFKVGMFIQITKNGKSKDDFRVLVYDHQMNNSTESSAARYFYSSFLGCKIAENAPRLNRIFYEVAIDHIDELKLPPAERFEARTHLASYLKSNDKEISAKEYARLYLPNTSHESFYKKLEKAHFPPRCVPKDLRDIKRRLAVRRMVFSTRVKITAPEDQIDNLVQIGDEKAGWTTVKINGTLQAQK